MFKQHNFKCKKCQAPLADLEVVSPDPSVKRNVTAECAHCGARSYTQTIVGHFAQVNLPKTTQFTEVNNFDMDGDSVVIQTTKVKDYV